MCWLFAPLAPLRINDVVMLGRHNSYKLAMPTDRMALLRNGPTRVLPEAIA